MKPALACIGDEKKLNNRGRSALQPSYVRLRRGVALGVSVAACQKAWLT